MAEITNELTPLADCEVGRVYALRSRNLKYGVYVGGGQFLGIRTKFGTRFLAVESHWENGAPYGTVRAALGTSHWINPDLALVGSLGEACGSCGGPVMWSGPPAPAPWLHTEDTLCGMVSPVDVYNNVLFAVLEAIERKEGESADAAAAELNR